MNGLGGIHRLAEIKRVEGHVRDAESLMHRLMETIREKDLENALLRDEIHALREQLNRATGA